MKDLRETIAFFLANLALVNGLPNFLNNLDNLNDREIFGYVISGNTVALAIIIVAAILYLLIFIWFLRFVFRYLKIRKEAKEIAKLGASTTIALTAIMIENCQNLIKSGELDRIVEDKKNKIKDKVYEVQDNVHDNVYDVIDEDFFDKAVKALSKPSTKHNFEPLIAKAYNRIADMRSLDRLIKEQYDSTFEEIKKEVTKWLRDKDVVQYLEITKNLHNKILELKNKRGGNLYFFLNPKLEDIIKFDYRALIIATAALIPIFRLSKEVINNYSNATVDALAGFMASFDIGDTGSYEDFRDFGGHDGSAVTAGDLGDDVVSSLLDLAGASLPYIGFAFILLRAFRFVNYIIYIIEKPKKMREMRERIARQIIDFLNSVVNKTCNEIEVSSLQLVGLLKEEFTNIQKKARRVAGIKIPI